MSIVLKDLLKDIETIEIKGNENITITSIVTDSRKAEEGSLFFALKGVQVNGHQYIQNAINLGANQYWIL